MPVVEDAATVTKKHDFGKPKGSVDRRSYLVELMDGLARFGDFNEHTVAMVLESSSNCGNSS